MRGSSLIIGISALLLFTAHRGTAQVASPIVLTSSGGYAETPDGEISLSWTAGELFVETVTAGERILTQGFQQNDVFINSVASPGLSLAVKVYPNPARDQLTIEFTEPHAAQLELFNLQGVRLLQRNIRGTRASISLARLPAALYLLRISDPDQGERRFKIQIVH